MKRINFWKLIFFISKHHFQIGYNFNCIFEIDYNSLGKFLTFFINLYFIKLDITAHITHIFLTIHIKHRKIVQRLFILSKKCPFRHVK